MSYRAVILDVDGTLVASNDAHARAWVDALAQHGRIVEFGTIRPLIGMGGDRLLREAAGIDPSSAEGLAIAEDRRRIFERQYISSVRPTRGAHELLRMLRDERMTLVVASSAHRDELHDLLRIADASKQVDAVTTVDDVDRSKPDPEVVRVALARTGCPASDVVMIGDTPYDVQAATGAGVGLIGVRCGGWSDRDLDGAIAVYDDPQDLLDHYDLSPFKRRLPVG